MSPVKKYALVGTLLKTSIQISASNVVCSPVSFLTIVLKNYLTRCLILVSTIVQNIQIVYHRTIIVLRMIRQIQGVRMGIVLSARKNVVLIKKR